MPLTLEPNVWILLHQIDVLRQYNVLYSETSLIRESMGPENNVGLGGCWIMECLLPYLRTYGDCTLYNGRIKENVGL